MKTHPRVNISANPPEKYSLIMDRNTVERYNFKPVVISKKEDLKN